MSVVVRCAFADLTTSRDFPGGDFHLADSSPYKHAGTDRNDIGANIDVVEAATCGVVNGTYCENSGGPPAGSTFVTSIWIGAVVAVVVALRVLVAVMCGRRRK